MTDNRDLRLRVLQAKAKLPTRYLSIVLHFFPFLDEPENKTELNRLKETGQLRCIDLESVKRLEYTAENYKKSDVNWFIPQEDINSLKAALQ